MKIYEGITDVYEAKGEDLLVDIKGMVVECQIRERPKPIYGKLEKLTPQFIMLRRLHGNPIVVNRFDVVSLQPTKANYQEEAV